MIGVAQFPPPSFLEKDNSNLSKDAEWANLYHIGMNLQFSINFGRFGRFLPIFVFGLFSEMSYSFCALS